MSSYKLTNKAKEDLRSIARHTQKEWGANQRKIYLKQFDDAFALLADYPEAGTSCEDVKPGYKKFPNGSHIVFYKRKAEKEILIVRVLHKVMDPELHLAP